MRTTPLFPSLEGLEVTAISGTAEELLVYMSAGFALLRQRLLHDG